MNITERIVSVGSVAWAAIIVIVSVKTFGIVNPDARLIVGAAIVLSVCAALAGSWWAARGHFGWAAGGLLVSAVAPTYFFWVVNAVPIVLALVAIIALAWARKEPAPAS